MSNDLTPVGGYASKDTMRMLRWLREQRGLTTDEVLRRGIAAVEEIERRHEQSEQAST